MQETKPPVVVPGSETNIPVLPLRDVVVFPHMVIPLFVGRRKSIRALEQAMETGKQIMLVAQKSASDDDPTPESIHTIGTIASILQLLKLPDGTVKVLVEGERRAVVQKYLDTEEYFSAQVALLEALPLTDKEGEALMRSVLNEFDQYVKLNMKIPPEILTSLAGIDDPGRLADTVAAHLSLKIEDKQQILMVQDVRERLEKILTVLESEIDLLQVEKRIRGRVKRQMEKSQREYYLNEQMKAIQKELGELEEGPNEAEELAKKIEKAGMSKEAREKAESELKKLKMMSPMSAEATVVRNYIDWLVNVPWKKRNKIQKDLVKAEEILEKDHYGLEKVKERILEYLAVQQRVNKLKGPILCLVGPPGVGKTSLGQSIARATNRKFVRMSLGGVRDEAEIRGHRRTYIGALPGRLVRALRDAGTINPVILLDEVDKVGADWRGDPSSALLEVLDPAQNHSFRDHYLDVELDLSQVMFLATANVADTIPGPLLDRMEVIRFDGYTSEEKLAIARGYLWPRQRDRNGLRKSEVSIADDVVRTVISEYTREAGVRNLERELGTVLRKTATKIAGDALGLSFRRSFALPVTIVRPFNAYGPGEAPDPEPGIAHAVPDLINKVLSGQRPLQIFGSGEQTRTLTHVDDIADGVVVAMSSPTGLNEDFNISASRELTVAEIARIVWEACGEGPGAFALEHLPSFAVDVQRRWPSVEKAERLLGWQARIGVEQGIASTVRWLRDRTPGSDRTPGAV